MKGLTRLITTTVPTSKIESTRFRSVAFQTPTAELPNSDDEGKGKGDISKSKVKAPIPSSDDLDDVTARQARQQGRAARWRLQEDIASEKPSNAPAKTFLTPAEKKRVAFIKGEIHESATTVHAYIVFAHEEPGRSKNVPPVMNPYEAANKAVEACDGVEYMGRTIRVDHVHSKGVVDGKGNGVGIDGKFDTRRTLFVGGLDFQTKEEDLRAFFEKLLLEEHTEEKEEEGGGSEGEDADVEDGSDSDEEAGSDDSASNADVDRGDEEDAMDVDGNNGEDDTVVTPVSSAEKWVTHVRLIRDQDTQLGKGIAYVEFKVRSVSRSYLVS